MYRPEEASLFNQVVEAVRVRDEKKFAELINDAKAKQVEIKLLALPATMTIGFLAEYQETFKKMGIKFVL